MDERITWLDYILLNNPDGVLKVLSKYGYTGYNQMGYEETRAASLDLMDRHGERGIICLLSAHPEYGAFKDLFTKSHTPFFNTTGTNEPISLFSKTNRGLKSFENLRIALGVFLLAYFISKGIAEK